ncbi:MAG TPA: hypothetical protein VLC28_14830 [Flavitalea sp.]|nr:hypothetical protein [Flavitalea sp.]
MSTRSLKHPFLIRLLHWEYWSFLAVYAWIYPIWIYYCLKARSFFFFSASNPGIEYGGFINESKKDIHSLIPPEYNPQTAFFDLPVNPQAINQTLKQEGLSFPLIGKPNKGGRGRGVKILHNDTDVLAYACNATIDFHIQEFVSFRNEVGIFYYRIPGQQHGTISGIVKKEFLSATGDGKSTIRELVLREQRYILQLAALEQIHGRALDEVLAEGEKRVLVPYGNHARGALFLDASNLIDEKLLATIDRICNTIEGFYFGRLDIRYNSWEELKEGKNLMIIEVNGAGSEPTHMYDPSHSLFFAWHEITRHWNILYRVSRENHRRGIPYLPFRKGIQMYQEDRLVSKKLELMPA